MNQSFENLRAAFGPWIDQLPGGSDLVLASNRLHQARDFASMGDALREIFVECLGFDEEPVQLARRFDGNKPIVDACQIARYDEFAVIAVEVRWDRIADEPVMAVPVPSPLVGNEGLPFAGRDEFFDALASGSIRRFVYTSPSLSEIFLESVA